MQIPRLILNLRGLQADGKEIVRVVSMHSENDDVQVQVKDGSGEYKIVLPIEKALGILGYKKQVKPSTKVEEKENE